MRDLSLTLRALFCRAFSAEATGPARRNARDHGVHAGRRDEQDARRESQGCLSPYAAKRPCTYPGCRALTDSGRCQDHAIQEKNELDRRRGNAAARGYGHRWRIASRDYLARNPPCVECLKARRIVPAAVTDHVVPAQGDPGLFWNQGNWQALCKRCHSRKTIVSDGRWGVKRDAE